MSPIQYLQCTLPTYVNTVCFDWARWKMKWITKYIPSKEFYRWPGLNCWELNWMPLARTALLWFGWKSSWAVWPGSGTKITRKYHPDDAQESRSFVISVFQSDAKKWFPRLIRLHLDGWFSQRIASETLGNVQAASQKMTDGKWILEPIADRRSLWSKTLDSIVSWKSAKLRPSGTLSRQIVLN